MMSAEHTDNRSWQQEIQRKGINSPEDFKDPAVSYSFGITKNDHNPNFCDHVTIIIL